jgi:hypothetical protein
VTTVPIIEGINPNPAAPLKRVVKRVIIRKKKNNI